MLALANTIHDIDVCDTVISTDDIAGYKVFDLKGIRRCFASGYQAALEVIDSGRLPALPGSVLYNRTTSQSSQKQSSSDK